MTAVLDLGIFGGTQFFYFYMPLPKALTQTGSITTISHCRRCQLRISWSRVPPRLSLRICLHFLEEKPCKIQILCHQQLADKHVAMPLRCLLNLLHLHFWFPRNCLTCRAAQHTLGVHVHSIVTCCYRRPSLNTQSIFGNRSFYSDGLKVVWGV